MRAKITHILHKIFGWGIYIALFAGAVAFFGFVVALIIGGVGGESLAVAIQKQYFPIVIRFTSLIIGLGLVSMYLGKEQALSLASDKKEAEEDLKKSLEEAKQ